MTDGVTHSPAGHQRDRRPGGVRGGPSKPSRAADQTSPGATHPAVASANASRSAKTVTNGISPAMNPEMMLSQLAPLRGPLPSAGGRWRPGGGSFGTERGFTDRAGSVAPKRRLRTAYRRIALATLDELRSRGAGQDELNWLLKAAALKAYPHEQVAGLTGQRGSSFSHRAAPRSRRMPLLNSTPLSARALAGHQPSV
ncbi:MAG: hypothetical protein CM15mP103_04660 [Gammaproteobacteria bacterium]|nr:MAG: hypothetical protein CM15mP103_04660 [Gammaproteobacteria bacterium]